MLPCGNQETMQPDSRIADCKKSNTDGASRQGWNLLYLSEDRRMVLLEDSRTSIVWGTVFEEPTAEKKQGPFQPKIMTYRQADDTCRAWHGNVPTMAQIRQAEANGAISALPHWMLRALWAREREEKTGFVLRISTEDFPPKQSRLSTSPTPEEERAHMAYVRCIWGRGYFPATFPPPDRDISSAPTPTPTPKLKPKPAKKKAAAKATPTPAPTKTPAP